MSTYGFRIRFFLPEKSAINHDAYTLKIKLPIEGKTIELRSLSKTKIKDSNHLTIRGSGFSSEEEAYNYGKITKNSLILCSTMLKMGINIGNDKVTSGIGKFLKDKAKQDGILLLDDVLGLCVFTEETPVRFARISGTLTLLQSVEKFVDEFEKALCLSSKLTDKLLLAFELYGASHFEISLRAKLLTLVSTVESMSSQNLESPILLEHIKNLMDITRGALVEPEKTLLLSRLGGLKRISIKRSCKKLIETYLGTGEAELFESYYNIRSDILHTGESPKNIDIGVYVTKLDDLVSKLLMSIITLDNT